MSNEKIKIEMMLYEKFFKISSLSCRDCWQTPQVYFRKLGYDEIRYHGISRADFSQVHLSSVWNNHDKIFGRLA